MTIHQDPVYGRRIDLNLLVALDALLEHKNVTHAAEQIVMSQPTVSNILGRLRRHFGDELLVRSGRTYELTPFAADLAPKVKAALASIECALDASPTFEAATSSRQFSFTMSDYACTVLVEPLTRLLAQRAPSTTLRVDSLPPDSVDLWSCLERRDLLIGSTLKVDDDPAKGKPSGRQVVFTDRFVCVASQGNPATASGRLRVEQLGTLRHVVADFGPGNATPADSRLAELGISVDVASFVHGLVPIPFAVSGTTTIGFVPERLARRCAGPLGLDVIDVDWEPPELIEKAHWHPDHESDPTLRWLRDLLQEMSSLLDSPRELVSSN